MVVDLIIRFDIQAEREHRHCSGEFEQLLLTCIEGCGLQSNRFKVRAPAVLTVDS